MKNFFLLTLGILFSFNCVFAQKKFPFKAGTTDFELSLEFNADGPTYSIKVFSTDDSSSTLSLGSMDYNSFPGQVYNLAFEIDNSIGALGSFLTSGQNLFKQVNNYVTSQLILTTLQSANDNSKKDTAGTFVVKERVPGFIQARNKSYPNKIQILIWGMESIDSGLKYMRDLQMELNSGIRDSLNYYDSTYKSLDLILKSKGNQTNNRKLKAQINKSAENAERVYDYVDSLEKDSIYAARDMKVKLMIVSGLFKNYFLTTCHKKNGKWNDAEEIHLMGSNITRQSISDGLEKIAKNFDPSMSLENAIEYFDSSRAGTSYIKRIAEFKGGLRNFMLMFKNGPTFYNNYEGIFDSEDLTISNADPLKAAYEFDSLDIKDVNVTVEEGTIASVYVTTTWEGDEFHFFLEVPVPIRSMRQIANFRNYKLRCQEDKECFILLDELLLYDLSQSKGQKDLIPKDSSYKMTPQKNAIAPVQSVDHYFDIKVYSDAAGIFNQDNPNGLIQTEGSIHLPLNSTRIGNTNGGSGSTFLKSVRADLAITKIEGNQRYLDIHSFDKVDPTNFVSIAPKNEEESEKKFYQQPGKYVNTFGLFHYSNARVGAMLNLYELEIPNCQFTFSVRGGSHLYFTLLQDSTVSFDSTFTTPTDTLLRPDTSITRTVRYSNPMVTTPSVNIDLRCRVSPSSNFRVDFGMRLTWLFFNHSQYLAGYGDETGTQLNTKQVDEMEDIRKNFKVLICEKMVFNPYIEVYVNPGKQENVRKNMMYFRGAYFSNFRNRNSFFQLQVGYKIDLFTGGK